MTKALSKERYEPVEVEVLSDAESYLLAVKNGDIIACKRIKQLAEMMLPRFKNGYKRWHFDIEKAERPVRFIETFCVLPESGEPMILEPFQKAVIEIAFGFVDDDGFRQFHEVLWELARKNSKSTTGAAICLYMLVADGEGAPQNYHVATSKAQASLAYGVVLKMMKRSKDLSKALRKGTVPDRDQDGIIFDRNDGYITVLTNQTRHLDGLNVHFCLFDEMAACTNRDQYDLIKQAMSARRQPMIWAITTNGFERENLFDDQYDYACGILDGKIEDDRMLPIIYELDDRTEWTSEDCWIKANPGLGTIKSWDYMKDAVNKGMQDPSFLPTLMTKDFNMPESRAAAWLSFEEAVNEASLPFPIADNPHMPRGEGFRYGVAGFDASDTTDLSAAKMLIMRPDDPHIYELSMYWLPEDALNYGDGYRRERDDVPYKQWVDRGLMRTVPGNTVPKRVFIDWLEEIKQNYDIYTFAIGYDPWHVIGQDEEQLVQYVGKDRCIAVRQGPKTLSQPMKQFRAQLAGGLVVNNHNPIDEWCRMNVAIKSDVNANIQPVKMHGKAKNRIDGFMAELCAYIALLLHEEEYKSNL